MSNPLAAHLPAPMDTSGRSDAAISQLASQSSPGQGGDLAHASHPVGQEGLEPHACTHCGDPILRRPKQTYSEWRAQKTCSLRCLRLRNSAAAGMARRARIANEQSARMPKPRVQVKGAASVEEFLARGGTVTICPTRYAAPVTSGSPVYSAGRWRGPL